jgi:hypothetical protein
MRVRILSHVPGRRLVVGVRTGPAPWLTAAVGTLAVPAVLALQAGAGLVPSPGLELPLLVTLGALGRAGGPTQEVVLQDGDALVRRGRHRWRLPAHTIRRAVLLEAPARLALEVDLEDSPALRVTQGRATVLETPWSGWDEGGALRGELLGALARLGLTRAP